MHEQHSAPIARLEAGLQQVHREAIHVVHEAGAYARRKSGLVKSGNRGHLHLRGLAEQEAQASVDRRKKRELSKEKPVDENNEANLWKQSADERIVQVAFR